VKLECIYFGIRQYRGKLSNLRNLCLKDKLLNSPLTTRASVPGLIVLSAQSQHVSSHWLTILLFTMFHIKKNMNKTTQNFYQLNYNYITGFTEADGCFYFSIDIKTDTFRIIPTFNITQDCKSKQVLYNIHFTLFNEFKFKSNMFVKRAQDNTETYRIRGLLKCSTIIEHFKKYPLHGEKRSNSSTFSQVIKLLSNNIFDKQFKMLLIIELIYKMNTQGLARRKSKIDLFRQICKDIPIPYEKIETQVNEILRLSIIKLNQCILDP